MQRRTAGHGRFLHIPASVRFARNESRAKPVELTRVHGRRTFQILGIWTPEMRMTDAIGLLQGTVDVLTLRALISGPPMHRIVGYRAGSAIARTEIWSSRTRRCTRRYIVSSLPGALPRNGAGRRPTGARATTGSRRTGGCSCAPRNPAGACMRRQCSGVLAPT